jgi:hypothetical protein
MGFRLVLLLGLDLLGPLSEDLFRLSERLMACGMSICDEREKLRRWCEEEAPEEEGGGVLLAELDLGDSGWYSSKICLSLV